MCIKLHSLGTQSNYVYKKIPDMMIHDIHWYSAYVWGSPRIGEYCNL